MIKRTRFAIEVEGNTEVAYLLKKVRYSYGCYFSLVHLQYKSVVNASFN